MANEIDAVMISTPDHTHFAATMHAIQLGKHVFVEKPENSINNYYAINSIPFSTLSIIHLLYT